MSFRFNEADSPNDHDVAGYDRVPYGCFTFRPLDRSVIVVKGEGSLVGLALSERCFSLSGDSTDDVLILEESATIVMTLSDDSVLVVLIVGTDNPLY